MKTENLKGLLLFLVNFDTKLDQGVVKKCKFQKEAYENLNVDVDICYGKSNSLNINNTPLVSFSNNSYIRKYFTQVRFYSILLSNIEFSNYDFIHVRFPLTSFQLLNFFKQIKIINPNLKIILDIPTYPYQYESGNFLNKIKLKIDSYLNKYLKKYVDKIVTYCGQDEILGIETVKLTNGIRIENYKLSITPRYNISENETINLVAVANVTFWHGYDRLIRGLKTYYTARNKNHSLPQVNFHIVGHGSEIQNLLNLSVELNVDKYVIFTGPMYDDKLIDFLKNFNIGISTIGGFRKRLSVHSSLKSREYCVTGIPFIFADSDPDFSDDLFFIHKIPSSEEEISISDIVNFYYDLVRNHSDFQNTMYNYAVDNLSWDKQIGKIIESIN